MFDLSQFFNDPSRIHYLDSNSKRIDEPIIVGIDEAGRGPVLGPMIYAIAYCPLSKRHEIELAKYQDSKTLTETQRSTLFDAIGNDSDLGWSTRILSPTYISNSMLKRSKYNLNLISHDSAIELIRRIQTRNGLNIRELYLDTVGPAEKYQQKLQKEFPEISKIVVAKKADSLYKIVSIASICAKVLRDHMIANWRFQENLKSNQIDYGSGYPSDPKTKEYLERIFEPCFGFPTFVRFSWSTITKIMDDKAFECDWDDDDDQDNDHDENDDQSNNIKRKKQKSIENFLVKRNPQNTIDLKQQNNSKKSKKLKTSKFFIDNHMEQVRNLDQIFK